LTTNDSDPNNGQRIPTSLASVDFTNPGPVAVDAVQDAPSGNVKVVQAAGAPGAASYLGYNILPNVKRGNPCGVYKGVVVEGFVGCTPGGAVYVDATSADAGANASGLSHTPNGQRVGVAFSTTRIRFD
jgi:hypothetical protein